MSQNSNQSPGRERGPSPEGAAEPSSPFLPPQPAQGGVDQDKVARAKRLLQQEGYPSEKVLRSVARHLARNWPSGETDPARNARP